MNVSAAEVPPPGAGLNTVTCAVVPAVVMSDAGIDAVTRVAETNVVVRSAPFQRTTEPDTNPVPFTVSVNAPLPAAAEDGERDVNAGTGFETTQPTLEGSTKLARVRLAGTFDACE